MIVDPSLQAALDSGLNFGPGLDCMQIQAGVWKKTTVTKTLDAQDKVQARTPPIQSIQESGQSEAKKRKLGMGDIRATYHRYLPQG